MTPAFCLALVHEQNARSTWGDILTVTSDRQVVQVDARDGRILHYASFNPDQSKAVAPIAFEKGAFDRRRQALLNEAQGAPNRFDAARPISSIVAGLLDGELVSQMVQWRLTAHEQRPSAAESKLAWVRVVRKLARSGPVGAVGYLDAPIDSEGKAR